MGAHQVQSGFTDSCPTMPILRSWGVRHSARENFTDLRGTSSPVDAADAAKVL